MRILRTGGHRTCRLEPLRTKQAGCWRPVYDTVASSSVSWMGSKAPEVAVVWDEIGCKGWAGLGGCPRGGRGHALLDANTPPFPRAQGDTPGPADNQEADLYE